MDIEEIKKYSKNKIEADDLIKQVRQQIKETTWEKQNMREGFSETFKPLISQFEKPDDPKTQNIFTQNQKMLQNQLALTEGIRANQKAITDGFSQFERLADMQELPGVEAIEDGEDDKDDQARAPLPKDGQAQAPLPKEKKITIEELKNLFNRYLMSQEIKEELEKSNYNYLPFYYYDKDISELEKTIKDVNSDLTIFKDKIKNLAFTQHIDGYETAFPKNQNPHQSSLKKIKKFNILSTYLTNLEDVLKYKKIIKQKSGSGIFYNNPQELLHRFELLAGSLVAGNNGVLPEYIQIAHRLRDHGIITNNQLNTLLRKII